MSGKQREVKSKEAVQSLKDLEELLSSGEDLRPLLEEFFTFLNDLLPILANANRSLEDTTSSMPTAADNIGSADAMAEDAAHTIMDQVDQITTELDRIQVKSGDGELKQSLESVGDRIASIQTALQFQDITSQHLQQARQIIDAIHSRMKQLFESLQGVGEKNELVKSVLDSYNPTEEEDLIDTEDTIRRDETVSQADIDALFGSQ
jgi:DNA polymerase III gamma/tau subunit